MRERMCVQEEISLIPYHVQNPLIINAMVNVLFFLISLVTIGGKRSEDIYSAI